ncbi:MAG: EamA family transporter [Rhizobiales bacterium]|nr:EamA family transporter [Hyphomicrobiales bacterium]
MPDPVAKAPLRTLLLGLACGIATALFWALGLVAAKHGIASGLGPADIALHRNVWVGAALLPVLALRGGLRDLGGIGWPRGIGLMIFGGVPFAILSYSGFMLVPLGHGGVIQPSCAALGGIVLSALVLREPTPAWRVSGALAIVAGLMLLGWEALATIGSHGILGDLTFASAGLSFAVFGLMLRSWRIPPMRAVAIVSVLSLAYVPVHWAVFGFGRIIAAGWAENLLQIAAQGVFAGSLSIYLFTRTVILLGASRAALFPALVPALTLLLGFLTLGDVPTLIQLAGLVIVGVGFRLAMK